jgi:hypothetical protein
VDLYGIERVLKRGGELAKIIEVTAPQLRL